MRRVLQCAASSNALRPPMRCVLQCAASSDALRPPMRSRVTSCALMFAVVCLQVPFRAGRTDVCPHPLRWPITVQSSFARPRAPAGGTSNTEKRSPETNLSTRMTTRKRLRTIPESLGMPRRGPRGGAPPKDRESPRIFLGCRPPMVSDPFHTSQAHDRVRSGAETRRSASSYPQATK